MTAKEPNPVLLCVGGQDPSGGAGIQADSEAARATGVHACPVITCTTNQDTCGLSRVWPQPAAQVEEQCRMILSDSKVGAIKIGLLGSSRIVRTLGNLAAENPDLPLVLDPVLASGVGEPVADAAILNQLRKNLVGRCTLITPNLPEARAMSGASDPDECAGRLLETGCSWVLITGTHAPGADVVNRLYGRNDVRKKWRWPRLPHDYHGSGCTLASAIAARLARGMKMKSAVGEGQRYTWETLNRARRTGRCQLTPNRLYLLDDSDAKD